MRILHIRSNDFDSSELQQQLEQSNQDVSIDSAQTVAEAVDAASTANYDCIVLEGKASDINGLALLQSLRNHQIKTPFLFSAGGDVDDRVKIAFQQDSGAFLETGELLEGSSLKSALNAINADEVVERQEFVRTPLSPTAFKKLTEALPHSVLLLSEDGKIVYANHQAARTLRFVNTEQLQSMHILKLFPLAYNNAGMADIRGLLKDVGISKHSFRWKMVDKFGEHLYVNAFGCTVDSEGRRLRALVFDRISLADEYERMEKDQSKAGGAEELFSTVVLCDGMVMKSGLQLILSSERDQYTFHEYDNTVVNEVGEGPDVAVYACSAFEAEDVERIKRMMEIGGDVPVAVVTLNAHSKSITEALRLGVKAMVVSESDFEMIPKVLRLAANGGMWYSRSVMEKVTDDTEAKSKSRAVSLRKPSELTRREGEVLNLLAQGLKNKRIADKLGLSYRTVVTHVYNIYRKLKISSRTEAIHYAIANRLVDIEMND